LKRKKFTFLLSGILLIILLTGCRARLTDKMLEQLDYADRNQNLHSEEIRENTDSDEDGVQEDQADRTRNDPAAKIKKYDENAAGYIMPDSEHLIHTDGSGEGFFAHSDTAEINVDKQGGNARKSALQNVPADEADEQGAAQDADIADSALMFYKVLLKERTGNLFECKRLHVYWEGVKDHLTVYKDSPEHALILSAGSYDVSARLMKENLTVDDGWVVRKNPEVIVKVVEGDILGKAVINPSGAKAVYDELLRRADWQNIDAVKNGRVILLSEELLENDYTRTAAELIVAYTAVPSIFEDVLPDEAALGEAVRALLEESGGESQAGISYYFPAGN